MPMSRTSFPATRDPGIGLRRLLRAHRLALGAGLGLACLLPAGAGGAQTPGAQADGLPRRVQLGLAAAPGYQGIEVEAVLDGATAANAGLRMNDVITAINAVPVAGTVDAGRIADGLRAGDSVTFALRRDGRAMTLSAPATAPLIESYPRAATRMGGVPFQGGMLRDILVTPEAAAPGGPVVCFLPGVACRTIEAPGPAHPYGRIVGDLAARGVATYRVEKPGMGDSRGGPPCMETDFATELAALRAGYRALIEVHGVTPERIFLFGHSMGAFQAPLLAGSGPMPAGVIVFGAVVRRWRDCLEDSFSTRPVHAQAGDAAGAAAPADALGPVIHRILVEGQPLADIAAGDPGMEALLYEVLGWDGADGFMGRSVAYWRGADEQRIAAAWADVTAPVLSLHGGRDLAVPDDLDPKRIVEIINRLRPGTALFRSFPETGHGLTIDTPADGPTVTTPRFNDDVTAVIADWILSNPRRLSRGRSNR